MQKNTRDGQLDYLKSFGMLLVTAGHCGVPFEHVVFCLHFRLFVSLENDKGICEEENFIIIYSVYNL